MEQTLFLGKINKLLKCLLSTFSRIKANSLNPSVKLFHFAWNTEIFIRQKNPKPKKTTTTKKEKKTKQNNQKKPERKNKRII